MKNSSIQWCDTTINPIMGCGGCELDPPPAQVLAALDQALGQIIPDWTSGQARRLYRSLIFAAWDAIPYPSPQFKRAITGTNLWHLRYRFFDEVRQRGGPAAAKAAEAVIQLQFTCYAAQLHRDRGYSLASPDRKVNTGYAPTFESVTLFPDRVKEAAGFPDLLGLSRPERPWKDGLPRLIFVSDMGDALSRKSDFPFLKQEVIAPIQSDQGQRHLWLWLTKRPKLMAQFSEQIGGFPANVCAMTTVTSAETLDRVDELRKVNAAMRGLSIEPLRERLPLDQLDLAGIDWVIVGGESGGKREHAREFDSRWAEELLAHCQRANAAFFLKQLGRLCVRDGVAIPLRHSHGGDWQEWPSDLRVRQFPAGFHGYRRPMVTAA